MAKKDKKIKLPIVTAKVAIVIGAFDPLHDGHIDFLAEVRSDFDIVAVILLNDEQLKLKKGYSFQNVEARAKIVESLMYVDWVLISRDYNFPSLKSIDLAVKYYQKELYKDISLVTCDEFHLQEQMIADSLNVTLEDNYMEKTTSSSDLIERVCKNVHSNRNE